MSSSAQSSRALLTKQFAREREGVTLKLMLTLPGTLTTLSFLFTLYLCDLLAEVLVHTRRYTKPK